MGFLNYVETDDLYVGEFKEDLLNGYGTYYWKNGSKWTGYYKDNNPINKGIFISNTGVILNTNPIFNKMNKIDDIVEKNINKININENNNLTDLNESILSSYRIRKKVMIKIPKIIVSKNLKKKKLINSCYNDEENYYSHEIRSEFGNLFDD